MLSQEGEPASFIPDGHILIRVLSRAWHVPQVLLSRWIEERVVSLVHLVSRGWLSKCVTEVLGQRCALSWLKVAQNVVCARFRWFSTNELLFTTEAITNAKAGWSAAKRMRQRLSVLRWCVLGARYRFESLITRERVLLLRLRKVNSIMCHEQALVSLSRLAHRL